MNQQEVRDFCGNVYGEIYTTTKTKLTDDALASSRRGSLSDSIQDSIERDSQKEAIKIATIEGIKHFSDIEAALVWKAVYETHIHRKSGINDADTIAKVVSADQSWKKSSGHAFE